MNTSILAFALLGAALAPSWQPDYEQAQKQAVAQNKPLAVIFGSGANGWAKVVRGGSPSKEVMSLLTEHYVRVYVDTATPKGRALARSFDVSGDAGIVISSRGGASQAFWHQGDMENHHISQYLRKYADPQIVVNRTETVNSPRFSYYPADSFSQGFTRTIPSASC